MNNSIYGICLVAALGVTSVSCNKSSDDISSTTTSETTSITLKNSIDQSRVNDYNSPSFAEISNVKSTTGVVLTKSSTSIIVAEPSIPSDAISAETVDLSYQALANTSYHIPSGYSLTSQIKFDSNTCYYVEGELTLNFWTAYGSTGGTIYVLDGGVLNLSNNIDDITIHNWGEINFTSDFEINSEGALYNYSSNKLSSDYNLTLRGDFYSASEVEVESIVLSGDKTSTFASCLTVTDEFYAENYANVYLNKGLSAKYVVLDSYAKLYIQENTLVKCEYLVYNNDSHFINESSDGYAVIVVETQLTIHNNTYFERMSGGAIRLHCDESNIVDDNSETAIQWAANVVINSSSTYISADDNCFGGYGDSSSSSDDEIELEHVASVDSPDYERISATSIDFNDGYVFVSWHEKGDYFQGYIDVIDMSSLGIEATYYTTELDFNHIYVSPSEIYVAGGRNAGAFYSTVDYSLTDSSVEIEINSIEGSSGNCIIQEDGRNWIVSGANGGITVSGSNEEDIYTELAEAKFVTKYGDNMAVLAGVSPSDAKIYEYNTSTNECVAEYTVGTIPTTDGKNTLFADGDDIYASLGEGGLKIYTNGAEKGSYIVSGSGSVNCVDVDDNYIYIANGVAGLYILDKTTLNVLKTYQLGDTSANYVKVGDNGLIYVAYGLDGVHVFKLKD
ncbi:MAG: hypothetical protein R3Y04_08825 [Rikenellaceae bacterium]